MPSMILECLLDIMLGGSDRLAAFRSEPSSDVLATFDGEIQSGDGHDWVVFKSANTNQRKFL